MTSNRDKIRILLKGIETGDPEAAAVVNEAQYIQHNPHTHEGSEGLAALFERLSKTSPRVNIVRAFEDGDLVFAHTEYDFSSSKIGFEVFRFAGGQAVEHWDNIQPRLGPNASGRSMVDGPTEATDLERTESNRQFVRDFIDDVLIGRRLENLAHFVDPAHYAEHDPQGEDGLPALQRNLETAFGRDDRLRYGRTHRVLAEGNFVLAVSEGLRDGVPTAFYDLYRIGAGRIVEHWNTVEAIPPRAEWKNDNGKF